jgi:glycosyltransferase involved in cell wall biosynthesis
MIFCIITSAHHGLKGDQYFSYAPYVREMNIWTKYVGNVIIVAPLELDKKTAIHINYENNSICFVAINKMDLLSLKSVFMSFVHTPKICWEIFKAMKNADHIHLRCPGNIGMLGCFIQILFPSKPKTAKYAGNWDPKVKQPLSYRIQKWILSNTFLTKNMNVLVYGEWENSTKNIKPFFTATYKEEDKVEVIPRTLNGTIRFLFVGTLSEGKRPLYAIQIVEKLKQLGHNVALQLFGEGIQKELLQEYCNANHLNRIIEFKGNQKEVIVREAYKKSHFVILPSQSEGWPKVIAEAMFWGCFPITTKISCLGTMLDNGNRGLLLTMDLKEDLEQITRILQNQEDYNSKVLESVLWSRKYTLDLFENEIKGLLNS